MIIETALPCSLLSFIKALAGMQRRFKFEVVCLQVFIFQRSIVENGEWAEWRMGNRCAD